uniref:Uncharacterized protein n=1 Tax=Physcomitrium patens TaxID=3218 RepID=A0A2K1J0S7_PHYPA|nr:hypothetical protein PHYPA_023028 [Physcomitrium patens]
MHNIARKSHQKGMVYLISRPRKLDEEIDKFRPKPGVRVSRSM